jgi:uncharacterized membrane protein YsdA (DUF1294 family)
MAAVSVVAFAAYGYDKLQAKRPGRRVPERWLHALAAAGGFAGCWVGMFVFRHKVRKRLFKAILVLSTVGWALIALLWVR